MPFSLGGIWAKALAAGAFLLGLALTALKILSGAKQAGRDEVSKKAAEHGVESAKVRRDVETTVRHFDGVDLDDSLRRPEDRRG